MVFRTDRKPISLIFETFGPVIKPFYSIRFNNNEELTKFNLKIGDALYYSPDFSETVNTEQLRRQKGCDASWEDDKECPPKYQVTTAQVFFKIFQKLKKNVQEFSDDEQERAAKQAYKEKKRKTDSKETQNTKRLRDEKAIESTLYICGLPADFRESNIKGFNMTPVTSFFFVGADYYCTSETGGDRIINLSAKM